MKSKSPNPKRKSTKKNQLEIEAEKEQALINLIIQIIVDATLKEVYGKNAQLDLF